MSDRLETRTVKRIEVGETARALQPQAKCPTCGVWGDVDEDQMAGRVSLICPECGWHGYITGPSSSGDGATRDDTA